MKELQAHVGTILLREWHPIGIADVSQAQDEYDSYVGELAGAILARRSAKVIASQLVAIETERMGLRGDRARASRVADSLLRLLPRR